MLKSGHAKAEEARRKAHSQFNKPKTKEGKGLSEYEKARQATAAKTARLRALRLEKEAADRESAAQAAAAKGRPSKAGRAVRNEAPAETEVDEVEPELGGEPNFVDDSEPEDKSRFIDG